MAISEVPLVRKVPREYILILDDARIGSSWPLPNHGVRVKHKEFEDAEPGQ